MSTNNVALGLVLVAAAAFCVAVPAYLYASWLGWVLISIGWAFFLASVFFGIRQTVHDHNNR